MATKQKPNKKDVRAAKEAKTAKSRARRAARIKRRENYFTARAEELVGKRARIAGKEGTITDLFYDKTGEDVPAAVKDTKGRVFEVTVDGQVYYRSRRRLKLA